MNTVLKRFLERIEEISKFVIIFFIELSNFIIVGLSSSLRGVFTIGEVILTSFKPSIFFLRTWHFPWNLKQYVHQMPSWIDCQGQIYSNLPFLPIFLCIFSFNPSSVDFVEIIIEPSNVYRAWQSYYLF